MALFGKKSDGKSRTPTPAAPASEAPPGPELSRVDFTGGGEIGRGNLGGMEVQEVGSGMSAAAEEAAVLYANGSTQQAEAVLSALLDSPEGAQTGEGLWMMLLDLYRLTGQRARFIDDDERIAGDRLVGSAQIERGISQLNVAIHGQLIVAARLARAGRAGDLYVQRGARCKDGPPHRQHARA